MTRRTTLGLDVGVDLKAEGVEAPTLEEYLPAGHGVHVGDTDDVEKRLITHTQKPRILTALQSRVPPCSISGPCDF